MTWLAALRDLADIFVAAGVLAGYLQNARILHRGKVNAELLGHIHDKVCDPPPPTTGVTQ